MSGAALVGYSRVVDAILTTMPAGIAFATCALRAITPGMPLDAWHDMMHVEASLRAIRPGRVHAMLEHLDRMIAVRAGSIAFDDWLRIVVADHARLPEIETIVAARFYRGQPFVYELVRAVNERREKGTWRGLPCADRWTLRDSDLDELLPPQSKTDQRELRQRMWTVLADLGHLEAPLLGRPAKRARDRGVGRMEMVTLATSPHSLAWSWMLHDEMTRTGAREVSGTWARESSEAVRLLGHGEHSLALARAMGAVRLTDTPDVYRIGDLNALT
jgi:hypothetical protein